MLKGLLVSATLVAAGFTFVSAQAGTPQEGRSSSMHHRHHSAHKSTAYGVGSGTPRTTATGGNAGGYTSRN